MICYSCKNVLACCCYLQDQEITAKAVNDICHVMGGFKLRKKGEKIMNLMGFEKIISMKGSHRGAHASCLLVSEKSKWLGIGKELAKELNISAKTRADLFIKETATHPEIIIRTQANGVFAISNANGNLGIRTNVPFRLYKGIQGIYKLRETESRDDGFYMHFTYKEAYGK